MRPSICLRANLLFKKHQVLGATYFSTNGRHFSPNTKNVVKAPHPNINVPPLLLHQYVWRNVDKWLDKTAIECSKTKQKYTYKEARERCCQLAIMFQSVLNLSPKDVVAIYLPNTADYPILLLAVSEAGVIATTINVQYTADEIAKQLKDSDAKAIITLAAKFETVRTACEKISKKLPIVLVEASTKDCPAGSIPIDQALKSTLNSELKRVDSNIYDNVVLPYSSGTTGLPKGVQLHHHNLVSNLEQIDQPGVRLLKQTTATQQEVVLGILPFFHIYGMVVISHCSMATGAKLVVMPQFDPKSFIETIIKYKISLMNLVPPLIIFLGSHPSVKPEFLSSVQTINSGAAPIGHKDVERLREKVPHLCIYQGYGMTETSPVITISHHDRTHKYASCGVPLPNTEVKITDLDTEEDLPANKVGELRVKGPQCTSGYLNKPEETRDMFDSDGFLKTGDLAYYDDDGDFFIVDRLKELIKVKGFQVAPAELEEILRSHPAVLDSAVIGVPDERAGESPKGFVVLKPGVSATADEIEKYVNEQVTDFKRLTAGVVFLKEIPKSASGKILRKVLKSQYGQK